MTPLRTYTVYLRALYLFRDYLHIEASSEEEARNHAIERFETEWSNAQLLDIETAIVPEEAA